LFNQLISLRHLIQETVINFNIEFLFSSYIYFLAFFGGRTNATKLYHKVKKNANGQPKEKISYVDVCSLYPYVNKYGSYPIGHPKIITENFKSITKGKKPYEGLICCTVIPPKNLLHPVLPYRSEGKLMFPLCKTCTDNKQTSLCKHSLQQRTLTGTWVTKELYKAVEIGYEVR